MNLKYYSLLSIVFTMSYLFPLLFLYNNSSLSQEIFWTYYTIRFIVFTISIIVFYKITQLYYHQDQLRLLFIAGLMYVVSYYLSSLAFLTLNHSNPFYQQFSVVFFVTSQFLNAISPLLLFYFILNHFMSPPKFWLYLPVILDVLLEGVYEPLGLTLGKYQFDIRGNYVFLWFYNPFSYWVNVVYFLSILWMSVVIMILLKKSKSKDKDIIQQQRIVILALTLIFVFAPLVFSVNILIKDPYIRFLWLGVFWESFIAIGLAGFMIAYIITSSRLNFFLRQPLISLNILNIDSGLIITYPFVHDKEQKITNLVNKNFLAINSMVSEVIGENCTIISMNIGTHQLMVRWISQLNIVVILIGTDFTAAVINRYVNLINQIKNQKLTNGEVLLKYIGDEFE